MEKRIGTITILIRDREAAPSVNQILSEHADIILCRQGLPFHDRPVAVMSLIVEGSTNQINALTGPLGRLPGITSKTALAS